MIRGFLLYLFLFLCSLQGLCQHDVESSLEQLSHIIGQSEKYDEEKLTKIDSIYHNHPQKTKLERYAYYLNLYEEYAYFNGDSASFYAQRLQDTAIALRDSSLLAYTQMKLGFILLSSGMFKEAFDSLSIINAHYLKPLQRAEYYSLMARCYYDLADYNQDIYYKPRYTNQANSYLDSALLLFPLQSFEHQYYNGLKHIRKSNFEIAVDYLHDLLNLRILSSHQLAITASTLSDIYIRQGEIDTAIHLLSRAAMADIQSSTKETSAIFHLATLLFKQGDVIHASQFIQKAANDANFYGSRQRKAQLSVILPLIEQEKLRVVQLEKKNIYTYAIIITFFFILLIILTTVIVGQVKKMRIQQKEISQKNTSLQHLLNEKEWLLREVHHRVKNNLHTIMSLLESQSSYLDNEALNAIRDSQHRVYVMSLIHQKLYQNEHVATIDLSVYLPELVNYLADSFDVQQRISFQLDILPLQLDISQAIPLGLIINEAITNALKYAFPDDQSGIICISIIHTKLDQYLLSISDNGVGLPIGFDSTKTNTLGMRLLRGLSHEIDAHFTIQSQEGTHITVAFTLARALPHVPLSTNIAHAAL